MEGPSNRSTTHPPLVSVPLLPVHCVVDMIMMRMIMGSLCQSTVYLLGGGRFFFFFRETTNHCA